MHKKTIVIGLFTILLASIIFPVDGFGGRDRVDILLTNDIIKMRPLQEFDCNEKIYVVGTFDKLGEGEHTAEVLWINPRGERQDYAVHRFSGGRYKQNVWFWLELRAGTGGVLFGKINPSAGMEEFIGKWKVKFYIDRKLIDTKAFFVAC